MVDEDRHQGIAIAVTVVVVVVVGFPEDLSIAVSTFAALYVYKFLSSMSVEMHVLKAFRSLLRSFGHWITFFCFVARLKGEHEGSVL